MLLANDAAQAKKEKKEKSSGSQIEKRGMPWGGETLLGTRQILEFYPRKKKRKDRSSSLSGSSKRRRRERSAHAHRPVSIKKFV